MAPTEGRVAKPEHRWGCRHGTPTSDLNSSSQCIKSEATARRVIAIIIIIIIIIIIYWKKQVTNVHA